MLYVLFSFYGELPVAMRSLLGFFVALGIGLLCGDRLIRWLADKQVGVDNIREDVPASHQKKKGTPSMGGLLIMLSAVPPLLLLGDMANRLIWGVLFLFVAFGFLGFVDDWRKMTRKRGLTARAKISWQIIVAVIGVLILQANMPDSLATHLALPFFRDYLWDMGIFYVVFMVLVVVGSSNAVNLTDGLDGLASGAMIIALSAYGLIAYVVGSVDYADYLGIHYIADSGELMVFCGVLAGGCVAHLWYNALPARVFMGDTGSLALGAALGGIAIGVKHELQLLIIGGLFVMEAGSVILQVGSYKLRGGKRIFLITPLHHHFEQKGWSESRIVVRFWIMALIFALLGLSVLSVR